MMPSKAFAVPCVLLNQDMFFFELWSLRKRSMGNFTEFSQTALMQ